MFFKRVSAGERWRARLVALALCGTAYAALGPIAAKTPGNVHCYKQFCHRVATLDEMDDLVGHHGILKASFYDDCRVDRFNTCALTSSGEVFHPETPDNAASPIFPDGTVILAYHPKTRKAAVLRINSTGPYLGDRTLDVSRATADKLGFREQGVAELMVTVISSPQPEEARYKKMRRYARVPGYMGAFTTFEAAHDAALEQISASEWKEKTIVLGALDEGEVTPTPVPDQHREGLKIAPNPAAHLPVIPLHAKDFVTIAPAVLLREAAPAALIQPAAPEVLSESPAVGLQKLAALGTSGPIDAASISDFNLRAAGRPAGQVAVRELEAGDGSLWKQLASFVEIARAKARATSSWPQLAKQQPAKEWRAAFADFVAEARTRAQTSVPHKDPLYRLMAELRYKAQPLRR